jgi:hypothetical protein
MTCRVHAVRQALYLCCLFVQAVLFVYLSNDY